MVKNTLTAIIGLLLLVSCSSQAEVSLSTETVPLPTSPLPPTHTTLPTAASLQASIVPPITKTPQPTDSPWWYSRGSNQDDTWYYEFEDEYTVNIFQTGIPIPMVTLNLFSYYVGFPETSYDVFQTMSSPVMAVWSDPVWSPNGRYLAFLGAIEGPSSDLYVFDTADQAITRLTSGENQAVFPEWSPDSEWIIHGEMFDGRGSDGYKSVWAARPNGSEVKWLFDPKGWSHTIGWVNENTFYSSDHRIVGEVVLRMTNIDSSEVITIFDFSGGGGASMEHMMIFSPESGALIYSFALAEGETDFEAGGFYISTPAEPFPQLLFSNYTGAYLMINSWDPDLEAFIVTNYCEDNEDLFYAVSPQGEVSCIEYTP